jgi:sporulation protein YlmC with PRC-barrel domain
MAKDRNRNRRDQAGVGPDPDASRRNLISIDDLDGYTIADGEPDIRGWDVRTLAGREVGEIEDLLVDPERGEVVMLEVEMRDGGVHAEVPIRSVQLDRESKAVIIDSGDIDDRYDTRARDRMLAAEREDIRGRHRDARTVSYGTVDRDRDTERYEAQDRPREGERVVRDGVEETIVERRPVIEEVVVRRRVAED